MTRFLYAGLALGVSTLWANPVLAQAIVPSVNGTGTQVIFNGNQFDIQGGALSADQLNLFHQFQQFGLSEGQIANFLANPALRNIVTQVVGGDPSIINGLLQVTGGNPNFYLMNPSGIVFGANAQLNLPASFAATTATGMQFGDRWLHAAGPNDFSALLGDPTAFGFSNAISGAIVNAGNLAVGTGSTLALLGGTVINTGQLTAPAGQILITAVPGESTIRLTLPGYILALELDAPVMAGNQPHTWQLPVTALPELLTTGLSPASLGLAVNDAGAVQLPSDTSVPDRPGTTIVSGGIDVSGEQGGTAAILGDRIGLVNAQIDASGTTGGGTILVGGDYQGAGNVPTAQRTYVDSTTTLNADALETGDGGTIIIWADEATGYYGNLTARGGQISGDGGFAEVSGRENLAFKGSANLGSQTGTPGMLLLDPRDITIIDGDGGSDDNEIADGVIWETDGGSDTDFEISEVALRNTASSSNVSLSATRNIIIEDLVLDFGDRGGSNITIQFTANGGEFRAAPESLILTQGRSISITAGTINVGIIGSNDGPGVGAVRGSAGNISLTSTSGDITVNRIFARSNTLNNEGVGPGRGGSITINSTGNFSALGREDDGISNPNSITIRTTGQAGTGGVNIRANNDINIVGEISSFTATDPSSLQPEAGPISLRSENGTISVGGISADRISLRSPTEIEITNSFTISDTNPTRYSINTRGQALSVNAPRLILPTENNAVFAAPLILQRDLSLTTTGGDDLRIEGAIDSISGGNYSLVLPTNTTLVGNIGESGPLSDVLVGGNFTFRGGVIETTGTQTYQGIVLTQNTALRTGTPGADITFNNTLNSETGERNNLTLIAGSGDITFNAVVGTAPNQQLGNIVLESFNNLTTNAPIQAGSFQQTGTPATGNITLNHPLTTTNGSVNLNAIGAVTTQAITATDNVALTSTGSAVQTPNVVTNGGDIALNAQTNLAVNSVTTNGGDITLSSNTDTITVNNLSSVSGTDAGGNITISNPNAITATGLINASGATTGGSITLSANGGDPTSTVTTTNLTATGVANGGNITVLARDSITAGEINTSATIGRGGNVTLDPLGDVEVSFINAQGGTNGAGGDVLIESISRFFRATGTFSDQNGILASISTAGGGGEGTITITHNGGAADVLTPFIISTASQNGTVGALTTGANNVIFPGSFLGPYTQGNIRIITSPQATLAADAALPDTLPEEIQPADADNQPFWLDEYFTRTLEEYLSRNPETAVEPTRIKSLEEIQDELREIERLTGVRPAVIYVVFEPEQIRLRTETIDGKEVIRQDRLTNQGTVLRQSESIPGDDADQLQLVLVTADEEPILVRVEDPNATRFAVINTVQELRSAIDIDYRRNFLRGIISDTPSYLGLSQQLYGWLIGGIQNDLERIGVSNLIFIMDNGIRTVPLAAVLPVLHNGQQFIVEQGYSVGLMPSFSLTDTQYQNIRKMDILAMGASAFPPETELSDLPGVTQELNFLDTLWQETTVLEDDLFTLSNLRTQRQQNPYGIIHLATHAIFLPGNPANSYIQLSDTRLSLHEIGNLDWNNPPVELLTLSACNTARDDINAELGFAGLTVQVGVKSALASIWKVDDFGTLALMSSFYRYLSDENLNLIKAEALRRAQVDMIQGNFSIDGNQVVYFGDQIITIPERISMHGDAALSHPYLWSGFTIVGNPW
ncbi:CHAT domain-containing protein [Leptolyngbya sp. CCNP1308]|uniref:CHAT domain-containing protein n=1 Tax=Leptolyngbya sp. CCNP1308 TaxID=3110255 RepID=UPI002B1EB277|nr:CHAT domain-containing protein [Leptolyngbya sp. CCNP1308]MEA5451840.1 CHAT domain-containing protein [Leptolyngbya sp. CCNP1308]